VERIPSAQIPAERSKMIRRLRENPSPDPDLRQRAEIELAQRLKDWWGNELPRPTSFGDAPAVNGPACPPDVSAELLIVRAISAQSNPAAFGVTSDGAVYTTDTPRWSDTAHAVFVTGLSPVLDEIADIFRHLTAGEGGRFYEQNGSFFDQRPTTNGKPFAFVKAPSPGLWDRVRSWFLSWTDSNKRNNQANNTQSDNGWQTYLRDGSPSTNWSYSSIRGRGQPLAS
jgi:hypothetical protein